MAEAALEKEPEGLDVDTFLSAFRSQTGQLDKLRALDRTTALSFMAAGACVSSDPAVAGPGALSLSDVSTATFTLPRNLRSVGAARQRVVSSLSDRAWVSLDEPGLADSIEGLALLCYLAERFEHPEGPAATMQRTIAGEASLAHGVDPDIPPYVIGQFVHKTAVASLPPPPEDLSPAFGSSVLDFVKLFNSLVVPLQNQALDIERLHAKDVVGPSVESTEMLWEKVDEAVARALLKNLFVQNATFAAFVFSLHKNIAASSDAQIAALMPLSEERALARLIGMSNDIETLQCLTRNLGDVHHALGSYAKALDRLGPYFAPLLLKLPPSDSKK
ncbi:hypothetical protein RQP46_009621 [Phenoliferia psychrophenolica]